MGRQQQITVTSDLTGRVLNRDTEPHIFKITDPDGSETELEVFIGNDEFQQFVEAVKTDDLNVVKQFKGRGAGPATPAAATSAPNEASENKATLLSLREAAGLTGRGEDSQKFKDAVDRFIGGSDNEDAPQGREGKPYSFNMSIPQTKALNFLTKHQDEFLSFIKADEGAAGKTKKTS